jgi:hypothetical protein
MPVLPGASSTVCSLTTARSTLGMAITVLAGDEGATAMPPITTPSTRAEPDEPSVLDVQALERRPAVTSPPATDRPSTDAAAVADRSWVPGEITPDVVASTPSMVRTPGSPIRWAEATMGPKPAAGSLAVPDTPPGTGADSGPDVAEGLAIPKALPLTEPP